MEKCIYGDVEIWIFGGMVTLRHGYMDRRMYKDMEIMRY